VTKPVFRRKIERRGNLKESTSMSIEISREIEARLTDEAQRQGISVDALLERLIREREAATPVIGTDSAPELPILHLGAMGSLHRRDIYDDVR
jgi:hypothetical protein